MIKSAKSALANHLGWDSSEMGEYEYQYGQYTKAVFVIGNDYYCASKDENKLPKPKAGLQGSEFTWIEVKDNFVNGYGWKIFTHKINS